MKMFEVLDELIKPMDKVFELKEGEEFFFEKEKVLTVFADRLVDCDLKTEIKSYAKFFERKLTQEEICDLCNCYLKIKAMYQKKSLYLDAVCKREYKNQMLLKIRILRRMNEIYAMQGMPSEGMYEVILNFLEEKVNQVDISNDEDEIDTEAEVIEQVEETTEKTTKVEVKRKKVKRIKSDEKLLKEALMDSSQTIVGEIRCVEKKRKVDEVYLAEDFCNFCIFKSEGGIYFGKVDNIQKRTYDNNDGSMLELTLADEDFLFIVCGIEKNNRIYEYESFALYLIEEYGGKDISAKEIMGYEKRMENLKVRNFKEYHDKERRRVKEELLLKQMNDVLFSFGSSKEESIEKAKEGLKNLSEHVVSDVAKEYMTDFLYEHKQEDMEVMNHMKGLKVFVANLDVSGEIIDCATFAGSNLNRGFMTYEELTTRALLRVIDESGEVIFSARKELI